jgi:hypothetical protein
MSGKRLARLRRRLSPMPAAPLLLVHRSSTSYVARFICRSALTRIHFIPASLTELAPLILKRRRDRNPQVCGDGRRMPALRLLPGRCLERNRKLRYDRCRPRRGSTIILAGNDSNVSKITVQIAKELQSMAANDRVE